MSANERDQMKRDPATILRRAMTHLRKRWDGHRGMNGHQNILTLKQAIKRVEDFRLSELVRTHAR